MRGHKRARAIEAAVRSGVHGCALSRSTAGHARRTRASMHAPRLRFGTESRDRPGRTTPPTRGGAPPGLVDAALRPRRTRTPLVIRIGTPATHSDRGPAARV